MDGPDKEDSWESIQAGSSSYEHQYQARLFKKLGNTIEKAERTADMFNKRIFWLTVAMAVISIVQVWPIISGWFK